LTFEAINRLLSERGLEAGSYPYYPYYPYKIAYRCLSVPTIRQRKRRVWEVRVFTGRDDAGRPTQVSRTLKGTKRDAQ
jgi:hypothetical protein